MNKSAHHWILFPIMIVLIIGIVATSSEHTASARPSFTNQPPPIDLSRIGTKEAPTTDIVLIKEVLDQIERIPFGFGRGWVHLVTTGYHTPPEIPDPLFPADGYRITEQWFFLNSAGLREKTLVTMMDQQGHITQQSACGAGICGNISLASQAEFDREKLAIPFTPSPFSINSASSLMQEVSVPGAKIQAWVEQDSGNPVFYILSETSNRNNPLLQKLSPEFEGNRVIMGIDASNGNMAYYSLHRIIHGEAVMDFEDRLITFEFMEANPVVDQRISEIVVALKARDGIK